MSEHAYEYEKRQAAQAHMQQNQAAQARPEGAFSGRIRSLASVSESHETRLRLVLRSLRIPPPEPSSGIGGNSALTPVQTTIEDQIAKQERCMELIGHAISELEGLFA